MIEIPTSIDQYLGMIDQLDLDTDTDSKSRDESMTHRLRSTGGI